MIDGFLQQATNLTRDYIEMQTVWQEATTNFHNMSLEFKSFIEEVTSYDHVAKATTIGFTFNIDDYSIFNENFYVGLTKTTLPGKQREVRDFIDGVGGDFNSVVEMVNSRRTFYRSINSMLNESEELDHIYSTIKTTLQYQISDVTRQFASDVRLRDVVCFVALTLHFVQPRYDHFELKRMLPHCDVTDAQWEDMLADADLDRHNTLLREIIEVNMNPSILS